MFIEKVFIFILFLGPLVFFHELGHFLFARLFGVRVEVFSIGFGPKLFKWKSGDTEYAFSLIPLGGYVKMFGDDPLSEKALTEEEKKVAFTEKSKWAKFWIVFGGPLANFILAYFLYTSLLMTGEKVPQARFGLIAKESQFYSLGIRSGDALIKVNDTKIVGFDDLSLIDSNISTLTIQRKDQELLFPVNFKFLNFLTEFGNVKSELRAPIIVDQNLKKWAISLDPKNVDFNLSIEAINEISSEKIYLFPITNLKEVKKIEDYTFDLKAVIELERKGNLFTLLSNNKFFLTDLIVNNVVEGSPADIAKIQKGDVITHLNKIKLNGFNELRDIIQNAKNTNLDVVILRNGSELNLKMTPEQTQVDGKNIYTIGVWSGAQFVPIKMVDTQPKGLINSLSNAFGRTIEAMVKTFQGYKKLFTNEVPLSNIGGPLAIGQVASDSFNISLSMFFRLMAIISINLGIINLFPIPVLDGGHIVFLILEFLNRGPLSRKKIMIAQQFGMSLLFLLIFVAIFNDISRLF